jgi:hypothetical protein
MPIPGTHFSKFEGKMKWGSTLPSEPETGEQFFDNITEAKEYAEKWIEL